MKILFAIIAVLFLASAAIPKETIQRMRWHASLAKPQSSQQIQDVYHRLENSLDTLSINLNKLP